MLIAAIASAISPKALPPTIIMAIAATLESLDRADVAPRADAARKISSGGPVFTPGWLASSEALNQRSLINVGTERAGEVWWGVS